MYQCFNKILKKITKNFEKCIFVLKKVVTLQKLN